MKLAARARKGSRGQESGIALFMVISSIALLAVLVAELTYSSQMNLRLASNFADNLRAYHLAKAGFRISMLRLKAYAKIRDFLNNPSNRQIKDTLGNGILEKVWSIPFVFPIPAPKEASLSEKGAIEDFLKKSKLSGTFVANITGESSKLNLNMLFVRQAVPETPQQTAQQQGQQNPATPNPAPTPTPSPTPVNFREVLEPAITGAIEQKKNDDREFAEVYRNVSGKDVMDAISAYLFPDSQRSELPGFEPLEPKRAPIYSLTELHLIPGITDDLYQTLAPLLTVYTTPGINVNKISKQTLLSLIPEMTAEEAEEMIRKRDDADVGKIYNTEDDFWTAVTATSAARQIEPIKARFRKANLKVIVDELSFKISVAARVGLSSKTMEAWVILDPRAGQSAAQQGQQPGGGTVGQIAGAPQPSGAPGAAPGSPESSGKKPKGIHLVYWRVI